MSKSGAATVAVLLLSAGLILVATALWRSAGAAYGEARAAAAVLQARLAAETGVRRTVAAGGVPSMLRLGASTPLPGVALTPAVRADVRILRASRELYRIEAVGRAGPPSAIAPVAYLLWQLEPGARLEALGAVTRTGTGTAVSPGGTLTGQGVTVPPPPWGPSDCAGVQSLADSVFPSGSAPPAAVDTATALQLGLLDRSELFQRGRSVLGAGTPSPTIAGGACASGDAWNWGSPTAPGGPCGDHRPLVTSSSGLTVLGGEGQGTLAVDGRLTLTAGARYYGVVLVGGDLVVELGAEIHGFVQAGGMVRIGPGSRVAGSACAALASLSQAELGRTKPVDAGWVDPS